MTFAEEILSLADQMKLDKNVRATYDMLVFYKQQLPPGYRSNYYDTAFLLRLKEKWDSEIYPAIKPEVLKRFNEWYGDDHQINELIFQGIVLPKPGEEEWQLLFEDESQDPIVHAYMKGWNFNYTALTG